MNANDRLAVVISPVTTAYNEEARLHVARFDELGLTSFGDNHDQAVQRLKKLFNTFIHAHRELGVLGETLNQLGVTWHWADEYPEDSPDYEDTNDPSSHEDNPKRVEPSLVLKSASRQSHSWQAEGAIEHQRLMTAAA